MLIEQKRSAVAEARERGYAGTANTPEYKRMQYEAECAKNGKKPVAYRTKAEKAFAALLKREIVRIEKQQADVQSRWIKKFPAPTPPKTAECRAKDALKARVYYASNRDKCLRKAKIWKHANPDAYSEQVKRRSRLASKQSDGTLTKEIINSLYQKAKRCAYCQCRMKEQDKTLDHIIALSNGGAHSIQNVVVCCKQCNSKKGSKQTSDWLAKVNSPGVQLSLL